jgi:drug/metabolite transporter (DMT)-like permease
MSIWISILLITVCALCWDVGVVWQKQAADKLPVMGLDHNIASSLRAFVTSKKWMGGLIISGAGWGLFVLALEHTPISLARAIQGSGFVILAFFSIFFLDHRLKAWEWAGVIIVTSGIVALGLSEPADNETVSVILPTRFILAVAASLALCAAVYALRKFFNLGFDWVVVFSIVAGTMLGMGDVFTKAVIVAAERKAYITAFTVIGPLLVFFYLAGFFILSRGYQHGRAILVTGVSDFCARLVTIFLGVYAMGESFPASALYSGLRLAGLIAILSGTALLARFSGEQLAQEIAEESS